MAVSVALAGACGSADEGQPVAADSDNTVSHAELEITRAVSVLFEPGYSADEKLAQLDAGDLRDPVTEGMADPRAKVLTVKVTKVVVHKANATAFIDFYLNGQLALGDATLALVQKDDRWLVERDSYCGLIQSTGPHCPPEDPNNINREPTGSDGEPVD